MQAQKRIIGESSTLSETLDLVSNAAQLDRPVLVIGERGTGKELIAERLHFLSPRWGGSLVRFNCATISESLIDSELFGHERGAFTGATAQHRGRFERADGGTLFLDELATLPKQAQEKLLRIIEYGEFERLGSDTTLEVDVRIVAATNVDLREEVKRGDFRADLLDRLAFDVISVPPLRHRMEDIFELSQHFATKMARELGWEYFSGFTNRAMAVLENYHWPGNIRELKNVVERSLYRWQNQDSQVDDIVIDPFPDLSGAISKSPAAQLQEAKHEPSNSIDKEIENAAESEKPLPAKVKEFEWRLVRNALEQNGGHQGRTAKQLGITYHQMRALLKKHK